MSKRKMPQYFWAKVVHTAIYIMNRIPTAAVHDIALEQQFKSTKPNVSHLRVFGCVAYV